MALQEERFGSGKTDVVRFKRGFGEGLLKDKFAFFEASKNPIPKRRKLLAKRPFLKQKGPCLKSPLNWTGSVFHSSPYLCTLYTETPGWAF